MAAGNNPAKTNGAATVCNSTPGVLNLPANAVIRPVSFGTWSQYGAALAQLVEHIIRNDGVRCSSHLSGTNHFNDLLLFL
jgi:hypothetical protein